uniref:Uncharacterized protein n=1 Tax=Timema cristinae TaxID=61476 RepID=A0A7R9D801_TIMCR|nr:unnamed protein product [Timema cristinae]
MFDVGSYAWSYTPGTSSGFCLTYAQNKLRSIRDGVSLWPPSIRKSRIEEALYLRNNHYVEEAAAFVMDNPRGFDLESARKDSSKSSYGRESDGGIDTNKYRMVFVINCDLGMCIGKTASQVVMSSVVWGSPLGGLTGLHVLVPNWISVGLQSEYCAGYSIVRVIPPKRHGGLFVAADNLLSAGTVLPNRAGNSLPGALQDHIDVKRWKRVRPSSPLQLNIQDMVRPQPRFLIMSRVDDGETLKGASLFIPGRVINGAAKSEVSIRKLRDCTVMNQTINDVQTVSVI